jgi:diadenosine tetraphosphate (Ap4A) HIT family hydrolase
MIEKILVKFYLIQQGETEMRQNETIQKFGYPQSLLKEYTYWVVLLRPKQVTLGSLILACKEEAKSMGEVSSEAFSELSIVTSELESTLQEQFNFDKINYLLLMMVDPFVHFHIVPRYASPREFAGAKYMDAHWPGPPKVLETLEIGEEVMEQLLFEIKNNW